MRRRLIFAAVTAVAVIAMAPAAMASVPAAGLNNSGTIGTDKSTALVTAAVTNALGTRVLGTVPAIAMSSVGGGNSVSGSYTAVVTEATRTGGAWEVDAVMASGLSDGSGHTIAANTITAGGATVNQTLAVPSPAGTDDGSSGAGAGGTLDGAVRLWQNSGESTSTLYTGVHTGTGNISFPVTGGTTLGTYTGTLTVTLWQ